MSISIITHASIMILPYLFIVSIHKKISYNISYFNKPITFKELYCNFLIVSSKHMYKKIEKFILDKLKENIGLKCPHGRPVAIKITRTEIDKWFKRII